MEIEKLLIISKECRNIWQAYFCYSHDTTYLTTSLPFRLKHAVERGTLYLYATVALGNREIDEREERGERLDRIKSKSERASEREQATTTADWTTTTTAAAQAVRLRPARLPGQPSPHRPMFLVPSSAVNTVHAISLWVAQGSSVEKQYTALLPLLVTELLLFRLYYCLHDK